MYLPYESILALTIREYFQTFKLKTLNLEKKGRVGIVTNPVIIKGNMIY